MRASGLAPLLFPALLLACSGEEPGGIEASVARATLDVNSGMPDGIANLDVTIELQALGQPEEVTLGEVMITAQPITDSSATLAFTAEMMNPQGEDPVVRMAKGETISARVLNVGTANAELDTWCGMPAELSVTVETADGESATATESITVRCS